MDKQPTLQRMLEQLYPDVDILFAPLPGMSIEYPAIIYNRTGGSSEYSGNVGYGIRTIYSVTLLTIPPDPSPSERMLQIPGVKHIRTYVESGVTHDVYKVHV